MAYYPHPDGSPPRLYAEDRHALEAVERWWHTKVGVTIVACLLALIVMVTSGVMHFLDAKKGLWLEERQQGLRAELSMQEHARVAALELEKQRVAFHLGYVGLALDRGQGADERRPVLELLESYEGDALVQAWARQELEEIGSAPALALGADEDGLADVDLDAMDDPELSDGDVARTVGVTAVNGDERMQLFNVRGVQPASTPGGAARAEVPIAAAEPGLDDWMDAEEVDEPEGAEPVAAEPEPAVEIEPEEPAEAEPARAAVAPRPAPVVARRTVPKERRARSAPPQPAVRSFVVNGSDRRARCLPGSVRTLRRVGEMGPSCGAGPGNVQQALVTGSRVEWIAYASQADKQRFVECVCASGAQ